MMPDCLWKSGKPRAIFTKQPSYKLDAHLDPMLDIIRIHFSKSAELKTKWSGALLLYVRNQNYISLFVFSKLFQAYTDEIQITPDY